MGTDIYANRSVVATIEELVKLINGSNKNTILVAAEFFGEVYAEELSIAEKYDVDGADYLDCSQCELKAFKEHFVDRVNSLKKVTVKEVRKILTKSIPTYEDNGDASHEYDQIWVSLWEYILEVIAHGLPKPKALMYFRHPRICGWEVPLEKPVLVFDSNQCFKNETTAEGEALRKALKRKKLDDVLWVSMSY